MFSSGLRVVESPHKPRDTADRLAASIQARNMTVFARIDHAAGAAEVGLKLRYTELIIFGNARAGTPLMQADQRIGIDLPLKALVYEDASGITRIAVNDPALLAATYGLPVEMHTTIALMDNALDAVLREAAAA